MDGKCRHSSSGNDRRSRNGGCSRQKNALPSFAPICLNKTNDKLNTSFYYEQKLKHLAAIVLADYARNSAGAQQQSYPYLNPQLPIEQRVNDLISRMTPEEKVSQMMNAAAIERLGVPAITGGVKP